MVLCEKQTDPAKTLGIYLQLAGIMWWTTLGVPGENFLLIIGFRFWHSPSVCTRQALGIWGKWAWCSHSEGNNVSRVHSRKQKPGNHKAEKCRSLKSLLKLKLGRWQPRLDGKLHNLNIQARKNGLNAACGPLIWCLLKLVNGYDQIAVLKVVWRAFIPPDQ